jgi:hypothetical protein
MRLSNEFLERVDEWRRKQPDLPSRAESIRRLTNAMLQMLDKKPRQQGRQTKEAEN